jgi:hypothetical protein
MRRMRQDPIDAPVQVLNQLIQDHYAYYGMAGNMRTLIPVYQTTEKAAGIGSLATAAKRAT